MQVSIVGQTQGLDLMNHVECILTPYFFNFVHFYGISIWAKIKNAEFHFLTFRFTEKSGNQVLFSNLGQASKNVVALVNKNKLYAGIIRIVFRQYRSKTKQFKSLKNEQLRFVIRI